MKAVLMSIQPKWCELIANGKKTIEVRKSRPKLETPFKVYIYATKSGDRLVLKNDKVFEISRAITGKVIGEFVCDKLVWVVSHPSVFAGHDLLHKQAIEDACLTTDEAEIYSKGKDVYGWHISDLVIYDKPKELCEFITPTACKSRIAKNMMCNTCCLSSEFCSNKPKRITRPPQSWCYVESEVDGE